MNTKPLLPIAAASKPELAKSFSQLEKKPYLVRREAEELEQLYSAFCEGLFGEYEKSVELFETFVVSCSVFTQHSEYGATSVNKFLTFKSTVVVSFQYNELGLAQFTAQSDSFNDCYMYTMFKVYDYVQNNQKWGLYTPNAKKFGRK